MPRYFLSIKYKGTHYAGFQIQENAATVQGHVERAMFTYLREQITLTGSSRTDAGVHANKNFFHFDTDRVLSADFIYHVNAILPGDIALLGVYEVPENSHARFDATSRSYRYEIYDKKDPFLEDRAWFYPFPMDEQLLNAAAQKVLGTHDFTSFAKRRTQVYTHICTITTCTWTKTEHGWTFEIEGNRFLRGMVRALVGTMVKVGRGKLVIDEFIDVMLSKDSARADFSAPAHGLFLNDVIYPSNLSSFLQQ
ncbi:MAG: tRNA pseudouridine(38-40) synthase TruA [bacterium]|jgi:tRNA pseudouridine38-40 synthase